LRRCVSGWNPSGNRWFEAKHKHESGVSGQAEPFAAGYNSSSAPASRMRLQSGYEAYVPKTRVVLWEAAIAAANGLTFDQALASITINAAKLIGVGDRVGSLEAGKDGDVALYDGDPF
jgi:hypothetical protein